MGYLQRERAVYRLPALAYLYDQMQVNNTKCKLVDLTTLHYLVNSNDDLPNTEKMFYRIKADFPKWHGLVGTKPTAQQLLQLLGGTGYLYMGHGAGCGHIPERELFNKRVNSMVMLFGCSSAAMTGTGGMTGSSASMTGTGGMMGQQQWENHGTAHSLLLNGCPCLLGCLW